MKIEFQLGGRGFYFQFRETDYDWQERIWFLAVTLKNHRPWNGFAIKYLWTGFRSVQITFLDYSKGRRTGIQLQSPLRRINYG